MQPLVGERTSASRSWENRSLCSSSSSSSCSPVALGIASHASLPPVCGDSAPPRVFFPPTLSGCVVSVPPNRSGDRGSKPDTSGCLCCFSTIALANDSEPPTGTTGAGGKQGAPFSDWSGTRAEPEDTPALSRLSSTAAATPAAGDDAGVPGCRGGDAKRGCLDEAKETESAA